MFYDSIEDGTFQVNSIRMVSGIRQIKSFQVIDGLMLAFDLQESLCVTSRRLRSLHQGAHSHLAEGWNVRATPAEEVVQRAENHKAHQADA